MSGKIVFDRLSRTADHGIHYTVTQSENSKEHLVLIYGYGGNLGMWPVSFIERLAEKFVVVCLDNRGVGRSISPTEPSEYSVEIMANDLDGVVQDLGLAKIHLLGYSLGGCIALRYTKEHQEKVQSLFLLSTTGGGTLWSKPSQDQIATLAKPQGETLWDMYVSVWRTTMSDQTMKKYDSTLRELFDNSKDYTTPAESLAGHIMAFRSFDSTSFLKEIRVPVTIFSGADDRLVPAQNSANLAQQLPQSKLVLIPQCEHYPQIEAQDALVAEIYALCGSIR